MSGINQAIQLFTGTSAGSTANKSADINNEMGAAIEVLTRISSLSTGPGSMIVSVDAYIPGSTSQYTIIASTAYITTGVFALRCATGLTSAANVQANQPAPKNLVVTLTHGTTEPQNAYRVSAYLTGDH